MWKRNKSQNYKQIVNNNKLYSPKANNNFSSANTNNKTNLTLKNRIYFLKKCLFINFNN